jgi:hypothetical protein
MSTVYEFATTDNIIPAIAYTLHLLNNPPLPDARSRKLVGEAARRIASKEAVFDQKLPMTYEEKKAVSHSRRQPPRNAEGTREVLHQRRTRMDWARPTRFVQHAMEQEV